MAGVLTGFLEWAIARRRSVDPGRCTRGYVEICHPHFGGLRRAQISREVDVALTGIDKSLSGAIGMPSARRVVPGVKRELTGLDERDRRAGMAVPACVAKGVDDDLLHHRVPRLRYVQDLLIPFVQLDFDVDRVDESRAGV